MICLKRVGRRYLRRWDIKKKSDLVKVGGVLCPLKNNKAIFLWILHISFFVLFGLLYASDKKFLKSDRDVKN